MWARKRFDIRWSDMAFGLLRCCFPPQRSATQRQVEECWSGQPDALACLSVRSGFDLLLSTLRLPTNSEVLVSAVTIPDMVRIIEEHDLVPVPVDLDVSRMAPTEESLRRAITPATRAIVVAHLFGSRIPLDAILDVSRQHGLFVIEDCAQAFAGGQYRGHPQADVSMFSFGPIKSTTALGGALLRLRDRELLGRMRTAQAAYPVQSRWSYLRRLLKYAFLKAISSRPVAEMIVRASRVIRYDYDRLVNGAVRGFAGGDFFPRIRQQPSAPLLAMMLRRFRAFDPSRLADQISKAQLLVQLLDGAVLCPAAKTDLHTYWVFPILVQDPTGVITKLRRKGFDATQGQSLCVVSPPARRPELAATAAADALPRIVYLPFYPQMPTRCVSRMARVLLGQGGYPAASERRLEDSVCRYPAGAGSGHL